MKNIFRLSLFTFLLVTLSLSKGIAQTSIQDSTATIETVHVDVGFLLNDGQRAINVKILHTEPNSDYWKTNEQLLKAVKLKLTEYSQEILSGEWSDNTESYQMHLTYDVMKKEIL